MKDPRAEEGEVASGDAHTELVRPSGFKTLWGATASEHGTLELVFRRPQRRAQTASSRPRHSAARGDGGSGKAGGSMTVRPRRSSARKKMVRSFSDRILGSKKAGARTRRTSQETLIPQPRRKLQKNMAYLQKYKGGVTRKVRLEPKPRELHTSALKRIIRQVSRTIHINKHRASDTLPESSSESSIIGDSGLRKHALAVLTSILPDAPSLHEVKSLAQALRVVRKSSSPCVLYDLDPLYRPSSSLVENWVRGAPSRFRNGPRYSEPPRDVVRDKVSATNSAIAEAMHSRTGAGAVESEQVRHRAMIKVFLRAMRAGGIDLQEIRSAFNTIDEDRSGRVDRTEFIHAMSLLGLHLSTIQIGSLFDAVDNDDSGDLSIDEFVDAITGTVGRRVCSLVVAVGNSDRVASKGVELEMKHQKKVKEAVKTVVKRIKALLAQKSFHGGAEAALMELFMKSDVDHSGSVSRHEFQLALERLGLDLKKADIDAILEVSDADKTGELEYWEFVRLLREPRKAKISRSDMIGEGAGGVPVFGVKHDADMKLIYGRASVVAETLRLKKKQLTEQMAIFRPIEASFALASLHTALMARHLTAHQLYDWFLERDADGSGTMEAEEFRHAIVNELGLGLTEPQVNELARALDRDDNGTVCYNEILSALDFDTKKEGKARRQAIQKRRDDLQRSTSAPLVMSGPPAPSCFSKSLKYQPMFVPPPKPSPVPEGGGRYATPAEAHRLWYGPNNRLRPMSSGALLRSRSHHPPTILYKRHTKPRALVNRPAFLSKSAKTLPATNFFSGMLGQKSLLERTMKLENPSRIQSQSSALPVTGSLLTAQRTAGHRHPYGVSARVADAKLSSYREKPAYTRPKSQQKIGRRIRQNEMVRASTAPAIKIQSQLS